MGTITVNVDDKREKRFRETVTQVYGNRKGTLGRAVSEAMDIWAKNVKQMHARERELQVLKKGFRMGKLLFKSRAELYER